MFFGNNTHDIRTVYFSSWQKHLQQQPVTPLEQQVIRVILDHPEYHALFEASNPDTDKAYFPELGESNPFLHLGLHLALRDQVVTDRPAGFVRIYQQMLAHYPNKSPHDVEHLLMEPLAECLWHAQRSRAMPNEQSYLRACEALLNSR